MIKDLSGHVGLSECTQSGIDYLRDNGILKKLLHQKQVHDSVESRTSYKTGLEKFDVCQLPEIEAEQVPETPRNDELAEGRRQKPALFRDPKGKPDAK